MYKNNSRDSSKIKGSSPPKHHKERILFYNNTLDYQKIIMALCETDG